MTVSFECLTCREIVPIIAGKLEVPRAERRQKERFVRFILQNRSAELLEELNERAHQKDHGGEREKKRQRLDMVPEREISITKQGVAGVELSGFLELPNEGEQDMCYHDFFSATSGDALKIAFCGICGREFTGGEEKLTTMRVEDIPNRSRLTPIKPHRDHDLYNGALLEPRGVINTDDVERVNACKSCLGSLVGKSTGPPPFSLANDMWIGKIPWELRMLTVPEQMLIARLYPRVFVYKLYPKNDAEIEEGALQRGMRGTVSTYELDMDAVASMIRGNLMPQRGIVLASVITVTFIGPGKLPKRWLLNTFRVRRDVVLGTLIWLKENNPKYYGDIEISRE
jgi:hypothetical protein